MPPPELCFCFNRPRKTDRRRIAAMRDIKRAVSLQSIPSHPAACLRNTGSIKHAANSSSNTSSTQSSFASSQSCTDPNAASEWLYASRRVSRPRTGSEPALSLPSKDFLEHGNSFAAWSAVSLWEVERSVLNSVLMHCQICMDLIQWIVLSQAQTQLSQVYCRNLTGYRISSHAVSALSAAATAGKTT
ncbi:hypothetical protein JZ751_017894 [Albula glossodonta]|uniref:Uncharacterized protein n=1 Tax=Albula glossodonta TaxID=121402 RepID=A0A8T2PPN2_9TELE|nr:hypothetical protein JZ751_017894 [Albula glossodonta]